MKRLLLIILASSNLKPTELDNFTHSLPAKSIKFNFPIQQLFTILPSIFSMINCSTYIIKAEWDLLEKLLIWVEAVTQLFDPIFNSLINCSWVFTKCSDSPSTNTPFFSSHLICSPECSSIKSWIFSLYI